MAFDDTAAMVEERNRWKVPEELEGRVLENVRQLRVLAFKMFESPPVGFDINPENGDGLPGFERITYMSFEGMADLAYACHVCKHVVIGPPELISGDNVVEYYCGFCDTKIFEKEDFPF